MNGERRERRERQERHPYGEQSQHQGGRREEQRGKRILRYPQSSSNSVSTFFFSNFPSSHGEYDMLKIFQRWARVKEVFISRRRNKWGRRFGFVRFFSVLNESKLEKELDQIFIGNMKLYVNLPKYRRTEYSQQAGTPLEGVKGKNQRPHTKVQSKEEGEWREVKRRGARRNHTLKYTYAEVVRKSPQDQWKGPCIETT